MVQRLQIFNESITLELRKVDDADSNESLPENADVSRMACHWLWATLNSSAVLNNCNNQMVSWMVLDTSN